MAQFAYNICQQIDEKTFREHFGFEKYVTIDGEKIINPTLLADVVTSIDDRFYSQILSADGKLVPGAQHTCFGLNGLDSINVEIANKYLATKTNQDGVGLTIEVQANQRVNSVKGAELILPESDAEVRDMYALEVSKALEDGCSIALSIQGGDLISANDSSIINNFDPVNGHSKSHNVTIVGIDNGKAFFEVSTYGGLWHLPFNQIHKYYQTIVIDNVAYTMPAVSHGFTAFHIVETNQ